jgi:hypothetical protein
MKVTATSPELNILNTFLLLKYCRLYTEWTAGNEYMQRDGFLHFTVQNYELIFTLILIIFLVLTNFLIDNVHKYIFTAFFERSNDVLEVIQFQIANKKCQFNFGPKTSE